MNRDPTTCNHSRLFGGVNICTIQTVPCYRLPTCALEVIDALSDSMQELVNAEKEEDRP